MRLRRRQTARAKPVVLWGLLLFIASQAVAGIVGDRAFPYHFDPEFGVRLETLRALRAEMPDRPLLLLIGSSRTVMEFRPEILPTMTTATGQSVLPFNFSHHGAGPLVNLMELQRLVRAGQRPRWLVLELMPPFLAEHHFGEYLASKHAAAGDLPMLTRYMPLWRLLPDLFETWFAPAYLQRQDVLHAIAPAWVGGDPRSVRERITLEPLGGAGAWCVPADLSADQVARRSAQARALHTDALSKFRIDPIADRALRESLELCRNEHIGVVVLVTPESHEFQSWYAPQARGHLRDYCVALARNTGVPVVDATDWLADGDFSDGHHVLLRGADAFTQRLGRDVLIPMVSGTLLRHD